MTMEAATEAMAVKAPPATVTIRRSWAIGVAVAALTAIVAMAIAVAVLASDDDGSAPGGFPQDSVPPAQSGSGFGGGMAPPQVMPEGVAPPQGMEQQGSAGQGK